MNERAAAGGAIGLFESDPIGRLTAADDVATSIVTASRASVSFGPDVEGRPVWAAAPALERTRIEREWVERTGVGFDAVFPVALDGEPRTVRVVMSPRIGSDGTMLGFSGVVIVESHDAEDHLSRLARITSDVVISVDRDGSVSFANGAARRLVGDARLAGFVSAVRDQTPRALFTDDSVDSWRGEITIRDQVGDARTLDCTVTRGDAGGFSAWCRDVTATVRLHAELAHQATHDALTGLPNRQLFVRRVAEAIERARVDGRHLAILYVDIDHLKDVNDSLGHESGDTFISTLARRLSASTRPGDLVGRIGGDEFVVLCDGVGDDATALDLAERVNEAAAEPVELRGSRISTGVSIGVAVWHRTDDASVALEAALELVRRADTAMYRAKSRGKGRCEIFSEAMRDDARRRRHLADDLERALAEKSLHLVVQPIAAAHSGRVDAVEALLRWNHPSEGVLTPSVFLDLAEESGLIVPIGRWVVDESARLLADWIANGRVDRRFRIHVNVSTRQVVDSGFVEHLTTTVRSHGLTPANLGIEYTASSLGSDEATRSLQSLRRLGFVLVLDDFGGGHSSLAHLRDAPSDFVKLDGTFVRPLGDDDRDDPMVRGVIQLAHGLDKSVIASWVTSSEQLDRLRAVGCDHVQGHHVARPTSPADFVPTVAFMA